MIRSSIWLCFSTAAVCSYLISNSILQAQQVDLASAFKKLLGRFNSDGDGRLSDSERKTLRLWRERRRACAAKANVVIGLFAFLLLSSHVFAQGGGVERLVRSFDTNKDGIITAEEFRGPDGKFDLVDRDNDGVISADELNTYFARRPGDGREGMAQTETVMPFNYLSSVDSAQCTGTIWVPSLHETTTEKIPLVIFLGGGQGTGRIPGNVLVQCQKRGWLAMGLAGRFWKKGTIGDCDYTYSMAYLDHPDPAIGPGQQDILDGVDWATNKYPVDSERIYLCGFSLGGRGAYMMGLKCPDRFAAIGPFAPATDMFELDIRTSTTRASYPCRMALAGGVVGTSERSAALRSIQSARFLIENAYNLPVFHGHGTQDGLAYNLPGSKTYRHGFNVTIDASWAGAYSFNGKSFGFGHTPTLSELHRRHPDGYQFAYMFTDVGHKIDRAWLEGASRGNAQGVRHPDDPERLIGAFDFFSRQRLAAKPKTVVYKSYTDDLRKAYWLAIDILYPWENKPGAVRATRDIEKNSLTLEVAKLRQVTIDLDDAEISFDSSAPLRIDVGLLDEPTFDPALRPSPNEKLDLTIALKKRSLRGVQTRDLDLLQETSGKAGLAVQDGTILIQVAVGRSDLQRLTVQHK